MRCRSCYCDVSDDSKRIELSPCGCRYCYKCMIRQQVASIADESNFGRGMECQCGVAVQKHLWYPSVDDSDVDDFEPEEMEHPELDDDFDTFRLWYRNVEERVDRLGGKEVFGEKGLLFATFWQVDSDVAGAVSIHSTSFEISQDGSYPPSDFDAENIYSCCGMLHCAAHPLSRTGTTSVEEMIEREGEEVLGVANLFNHIVVKDHRMFPRMIYALATGNEKYALATNPDTREPIYWEDDHFNHSIPPVRQTNASHQGTILASYLASDIAMRASEPRSEIGMSIETVTATLEYAPESQRHDVLNRFRLVTSRPHRAKGRAKFVMKHLEDGIQLGDRGLLSISADNIEKKKKDGTFNRMFSVLHWCKDEEKLVETGVYFGAMDGVSDDDVREAVEEFFRENDFEALIEGMEIEEILDDVWRSGEKEFSHLGESFLTHCAIVVRAIQHGDVPTLEWCRTAVDTGEFELNGGKRPVLHRYSREEDIDTYEEDRIRRSREIRNVHEEKPSLWKLNNVKSSIIGHGSFQKKSTIRKLLDYINRVGDDQIKAWVDAGCDPRTVPVSAFFRFFVGDGAPIITGMNILDEELSSDMSEEDRQYSKIKLVIGAFHFYMEVFKKANELGKEMATFLASTFKGTNPDSLKYFLDFSDPTNPEKEMASMLLAIYAYVIRCMERNAADDAEDVPVSPVSIHDYMLDRSKECPTAMALLHLVLLYETVILARRAIRLNDFELFISVMKLSLPLFASTHATNYIRMTCNYLERIKTMSKAERKITEEFCFTALTVNGERVGIDQIHEFYVKAVRHYGGGKIAKVGDERLMEFASLAATHAFREMDSRAMEELYKGGYGEEHYRPILENNFKVYALVTVALEDSSIFDPGPEIIVGGEEFNEEYRYLSPVNGKPLLAELLRYRAKAQPKVDKYVERFYITTRNEVHRSEEDMGVPKVISTSDGIADIVKKRIDLATSKKISVLCKSGTRKDLKAELLKMERFLGTGATPSTVTENSDKELIANTVVRFRKRLTRAQLNELKEEAKRSEEMLTTPQQREQDLEDFYYCFLDETKEKPCFTAAIPMQDLFPRL